MRLQHSDHAPVSAGRGPVLAEHGACSVFYFLYSAWEDAVEGSGNPLLFLFLYLCRFNCLFASFVNLSSFNPENTKGRQKHIFSNISTKKG
ncbi:hypothetical protein Hanom_Chr02g00128751 [Helianthus anomalus]